MHVSIICSIKSTQVCTSICASSYREPASLQCANTNGNLGNAITGRDIKNVSLLTSTLHSKKKEEEERERGQKKDEKRRRVFAQRRLKSGEEVVAVACSQHALLALVGCMLSTCIACTMTHHHALLALTFKPFQLLGGKAGRRREPHVELRNLRASNRARVRERKG